MFTAYQGSSAQRPAQMFSQTYQQVSVTTGVDGASPHQLVMMLYVGALDALARARGAMRAGQIEAKGKHIGQAVRIVDEGLKAALNPAGGDLTAKLSDLYGYISLRLTQANLRNDEAAIEECVKLIEPLRDAWSAIRPQTDVPGAKQ